ncbi:PAS domain-containing hybrid sensor histidine kinase/response regulator [Pelagicoccus mobilis]|uniref:histidine kinase n=1 Tax=Pelagicoccus mobilis TaxID=415221 RepID=A0A934RSE1_9BACT|nr:PAS domain-containing hybrid sensor histidine kinase/response regulator [Pelagicoccus mobilis]MBK1876002.1 response regulator [Pelagicoccus mobilis]
MMDLSKSRLFHFVISLAVGLIAALIVSHFLPESGLVLAIVPMVVGVATFLVLEARPGLQSASARADLITPNQCHPALSAAGVGAWLWDVDSGEFHCTEDVLHILGFEDPSDSLSIKAFKESVFREDKEVFDKAVEGVISGHRKSPIDCRFVKRDHSLVWVEVTMCLVEGETRGVQIAGALTDVTERKHVEAQLDRGSAYLEAILESTDDMVFSIDRQFRLVMVNRRFLADMRAAYGVSLHLGDDVIENLSDELVKIWKPRFDRTLAGESLRVEDAFLVRGDRLYFDVSLKPIREAGYINGVAVYSRNVTKQRQREKELQKAKEQAVESDRLKSAFLANMSHEIRTPLNAVMGFAQLLKGDALTEEENARFVDVILSNGNHLLHILGDIIDLAQIESGQLRIEPVPCDLGLLMAETYSVFFDRIRSQADGLIDLVVENNVREADYVVCDQTRLKQIVYNLVSNAIKFTLQGTIHVGYQKQPDGMIEFFVADTGSGILPEMKKRVFQRFRQGSDSVGRSNDGVGLGLSICEGLVKLLGGRIWVEDNHPHGSVFKFTVKDHADKYPLPVAANANYGYEGRLSRKEEAAKIKVLIAEDDDTNYLVIEEFLRFEKIESIRAVNGKEAVEMVEQYNDIGLIVMDLSMPIMDGLDATRAIKRIKPDIPVIAHTAHAMQSELDKALAAGCSDCLVKPISIESFREILEQYS